MISSRSTLTKKDTPLLALLAVVAAAVVVFLVVLTTIDQQPAKAASPVQNGRIAYASQKWLGPSIGQGYEASEIYTVDLKGNDPRQLTHNAYWDNNPALSPDGTRIAFDTMRETRGKRNQEIYLKFVTTGGGANLTRSPYTNEYDPAWSPDGAKIAFVVGGGEIFVMNADGTGRRNLTNTPKTESMPTWSPDGTKIAFVRVDSEGEWEIFVMNADGSGQKRLTYSPQYSYNYGPDWSPDGAKIAFTLQSNGAYNVYTMNADGSGVKQLTKGGALDPAWSPDGTKIAFNKVQEGHYDIFTMNIDGTHRRNLTNTPEVDEATPSWEQSP
jgi:tol-pal system beta propeller repeat protein TolB